MNKLHKCLVLALLLTLDWTPIVMSQDDEEVQRPNTEELLPENTVLFLQVDDILELIERFGETGMGQVMQQEEVSNLVNGLWDEGAAIYDEYKDDIGLELSDFQDFPGGEISFAVVAPKRGDLQIILMLEVDEESDAVQNVLNRGREFVEEQGSVIEEDDTGDVVLNSFTGEDGQRFSSFLKDGLFVTCNDEALILEVVDRWMGREVETARPLTENRKFSTVMNRCKGTKDVPPDFRFYMDPIEFAKAATRGDIGTQTVINFLPILGLDGLSAVGASAIFDEMGYESVGHAHVMLANPRAGIIKMLALRPGQYTPESWIPEDAGSYISSSWDLNQFVNELEKIVDTFGGENFFQDRVVSEFAEETNMDLYTDVLDTFTGRISYCNWMQLPATFSSQIHVFGFELTDVEKFENMREIIFSNIEEEDGDLEEIEEVNYKGMTYWKQSEASRQEQRDRIQEWRQRRAEERGREVRDQVEPEMNPCFGLIGDYLVFATSPQFMERAMDTERGEVGALVDDEEFIETTEQMVKLLGNDMPAAIMYQQPGKAWEMMFGLPNSDDMEKTMQLAIEEEDENSIYAERFRDVFENNQLPDFEEVRGFFAPGGAFITEDDTGYHLMTFQLKWDR